MPPTMLPTLNSRILAWRAILLLVAIWCIGASSARAQTSHFDVVKGKHVVGRVTAIRTAKAERTIYLLTSYSQFDIVFKQVVRSTGAAEYLNGELASCYSSVVVNDAIRDSSHMARASSTCYVHPASIFNCTRTTEWTTGRMYFEEPVGQTVIFVESALKDCPLKSTGKGGYTLTLPNKSENHYLYREGVLHEIRVDRSFFDLVFRRRA